MSLNDVELNLITSMDDVFRFKEWLGRRRSVHALGLDTETTGLNPLVDHVRLIQIGDADAGWAFARDDWLGLLKDVVARWDGDWILHNAPFDVTALDVDCGVKIPTHRIHDTMVQSRIAEPHVSMALKEQATRHIDPAAAGLQTDLANTKWTWKTVPIDYDPYWMYGALDPVLTYRLHQHHYSSVMRSASRAYEIEMAVMWVVNRMRRYGAYIDREFASQRRDAMVKLTHELDRWIQETYSVKPGSDAAIIEVLMRDGIEFTKMTKSGSRYSLDSEVLDTISHPLADAVRDHRKATKMISTYLNFYVDQSDANSLIHPTFNTLGARTSRMSCSDPNLQNLPRLGTSKFGDVVRSCIASRYIDPGDLKHFDENGFTEKDAVQHGSLIMSDFDQIEMRMLAAFANEESMINAFKSEGDFFVNLARQIYGDETITKKDKRRQITKNAGYAKIYFAGLVKFAQTAGIPVPQAREFLNRFDSFYPGVHRFQNQILQLATERQRGEGLAYARSPLTGRMYVADHRKEYTLINYLTQGTAAEVNKMKLIELDAAGLGEFMYATIHDEVQLDVPGPEVRNVVNVLDQIMNDYDIFRVPITAGTSYGHRWGRKSDWNEA